MRNTFFNLLLTTGSIFCLNYGYLNYKMSKKKAFKSIKKILT